jgi:hypothetical protein
LTILIHQRDQEIHLPFHSGWYGSPGLLVAVDGLYGDPQQLCHLLLGLAKLLAEMDELFAVHGEYRESDTWVEKRAEGLGCHNVAWMSIGKIPSSQLLRLGRM